MNVTKEYLIKYYYVFVCSFYLSSMVIPSIRTGVLGSGLILLIIFLNNRYLLLLNNKIHLLVFTYIFYNTFSAIFYISNQIPFYVFIQEYSSSILPIAFFYIGYFGKNSQEKAFYKVFTYCGIFILVVGIYFLFFPNDMYYQYLFRSILNFTLQTYMSDMRLNSFLGSQDIGLLASLLVAISLFGVMLGQNIKWNIIVFIFSIVASALSLQRASYLSTIIIILILLTRQINKSRVKQFLIISFLLIITTFSVRILFYDTIHFDQIVERISAFNTAIAERSNSWKQALSHTTNLIFGQGLGSVGHKAIKFSKYYVRDGNYFKIIAEIGIIGFIIFLNIMYYTYREFLRNKKRHIFNFSIISIFLIQAIGTNVLSFQIFLPVFWYSVGRIWSPQRIN